MDLLPNVSSKRLTQDFGLVAGTLAGVGAIDSFVDANSAAKARYAASQVDIAEHMPASRQIPISHDPPFWGPDQWIVTVPESQEPQQYVDQFLANEGNTDLLWGGGFTALALGLFALRNNKVAKRVLKFLGQ